MIESTGLFTKTVGTWHQPLKELTLWLNIVLKYRADFCYKIHSKNCLTHSGISPLGTTILRVSCMRLYFMILSADVVEVSEGEAFTYESNRDLSLSCSHLPLHRLVVRREGKDKNILKKWRLTEWLFSVQFSMLSRRASHHFFSGGGRSGDLYHACMFRVVIFRLKIEVQSVC